MDILFVCHKCGTSYSGGTVCPKCSKNVAKENHYNGTLRIFECYYFSDLVKYLGVLDSKGGQFVSAVADGVSLLNRKYVVVYRSLEPIEMEILC